MRQPDTIKISWDQLDSNKSGGTWALSVSSVPNKGIFGAEYSLIYTIDKFKKKVEVLHDNTSIEYVKRLHNLFGQCLQGAVTTRWTAVLDTFPVATGTDITFKEALKIYLEMIVEVPNLKGMLICQIQNNIKPKHM
eukprot:14419314-Ditylum_brightwellii.AAC.1